MFGKLCSYVWVRKNKNKQREFSKSIEKELRKKTLE